MCFSSAFIYFPFSQICESKFCLENYQKQSIAPLTTKVACFSLIGTSIFRSSELEMLKPSVRQALLFSLFEFSCELNVMQSVSLKKPETEAETLILKIHKPQKCTRYGTSPNNPLYKIRPQKMKRQKYSK